jgi:hypothetical protein
MVANRSSGSVVVAPGTRFDGLKVFSATVMQDRLALGESVTAWIAWHPQYRVTEFVVAQSSDSQFHCVSITLFYALRA